MRQQLPKEIDPFRFAHQGRVLEGEIELKNMSRLSDLLHSNEGKVNVLMHFDIDGTGMPYLHGQFSTTLTLTCERCMEALEWPVSIDTMLGMLKHEKLAETLSDQYEPWVISDSDPIDPSTVIEDELILALPLVPKHENDCLPQEAMFSGEIEEVEEADKPASPFAVLSALKSKK